MKERSSSPQMISIFKFTQSCSGAPASQAGERMLLEDAGARCNSNPTHVKKGSRGADGERRGEIHPERQGAGLPTGMSPAKGPLGRLVRGYKASHFLPRNHHLSRHL